MQSSAFIPKSACRGYRPGKFSSYRGHQRPHLIARLVKERSIARFIVAPPGYGKTSLVVDYAETMFSWAHSFWVPAQSPCFVRDLDEGGMAAMCFECDADVKLVVFDDVPQLDAQRAQAFSDEIDAFLERGCEVVVICSPACDLYAKLQRDRVRLGAADLLLTDDELDATRSAEDRIRRPAQQLSAAFRVPALAWGTDADAPAVFVRRNLAEDLPADLLLATCSAYVLQRGSFSDLSELGDIDWGFAADALVDYPHLGFDAESERFEAPVIEVDAIAHAVKSQIDAVVSRSPFDTRDSLARAWADILMRDRDRASRACDIVRLFCPIKSRVGWLDVHARDLAGYGCFYQWLRVIRSLKGSRRDLRGNIEVAEALCRRMLGDEDGALRCAKRCAFDASSTGESRAVGLLITVQLAKGELRSKAAGALARWPISQKEPNIATLPWWDVLVAAWNARTKGAERLHAAWRAMHDAGIGEDILCVVASWLFRLVGEAWEQSTPIAADVASDAERYVRALLAGEDAASISFFATSAGLSMEEAHAKGMVYADGPLPAASLFELRRAEMLVMAQRRQFIQDAQRERAQRTNWALDVSPAAVPAGFGSVIERKSIPTLELRAFGRFDVSIGDVPLEARLFSRKNTRALFVLLAAYQGRDLSRDQAAEAMWPKSDVETARKNFCTVWSQLKRALTLSDGTCPYLVRHQFGCRLESRYAKSDIAHLDAICRELLFGKVDFDAWIEMYNEIDRDFSSELLPSEDNPLVVRVRRDYRNRLIDALIAGAGRLVDAGNPKWGIWFARSALERENTREDAYMALMRAQVAHDQRTAAMMTYLNCRNTLNEELGIDPSPELTAFYEKLLGEG